MEQDKMIRALQQIRTTLRGGGEGGDGGGGVGGESRSETRARAVARRKSVGGTIHYAESTAEIVGEINEMMTSNKTRILDVFRHMDSDRDGSLSEKELYAGLLKLGVHFDVDSDGAGGAKAMREVFEALDEDGSNNINLKEMKSALKKAKSQSDVIAKRKSLGSTGMEVAGQEAKAGKKEKRRSNVAINIDIAQELARGRVDKKKRAAEEAARRAAEKVKRGEKAERNINVLSTVVRAVLKFKEPTRDDARAVRKRERTREAEERRLMNEEEWRAERVQWFPDRVVWPVADPMERARAAARLKYRSWSVVRVFISSTFNDMHGERDVLNKLVFPELNEIFRTRRVRIVPIDLRWGLTAEDTSDAGLGALEHCLLEIDNTRPFFLLLQGARYGWTPPGYRVSDRPEFAWAKRWPAGHSITAMEIFHGFLRKPFTPVHAWCYKRDMSFLSHIENENERRIFEFDHKGDDDCVRRFDKLKEDVENMQYCKMRDYSCIYAGRDSFNKPTVKGLTGSGHFADAVFHDLCKAIDAEFPLDPEKAEGSQEDELSEEVLHENLGHESVVQLGAEQFVSRDMLMSNLTSIFEKRFNLQWSASSIHTAHNNSAHNNSFIMPKGTSALERFGSAAEMLRSDSGCSDASSVASAGGGGGGGATRREARKVKKNVPPFALLGDPGSGKSSAVMAFIRRFQAIHGDAVVVIPHVVGATPSSTDLASLLFRIGSEVQRAIGVVEGEEDKVDKLDHDTLTAAKLWFAETLQQAGERAHALGTRILVVIDSVDEMEVVHGALEMDWVPPSTHYCCQIMVSFTILEGHPSITALNRRDPPFETLIVGDLLPKERTLLATHFLAMNRKKLNDEQLSLLVAKVGAGKCLYIRVACEELMVQGQYGDGTFY